MYSRTRSAFSLVRPFASVLIISNVVIADPPCISF
nr:MAG TPA: IlvGEDA operon leader peptide [Caudoviricetes sp.]